MSDPYSPYPAGPVHYAGPQPTADGTPGAAKAAGIIMIVLAALALLCTAGAGLFAGVATPEAFAEATADLPPDQQAAFAELGDIRVIAAVLAAAMAVYGVVSLVLAVFVLRNHKWAMITAIVLLGLVLAYQAVNLVLTLASGVPAAVCGAVFAPLPHVAVVVLLALALRARGRTAAPSGQDVAAQQAAWRQYYAQQQPPPQAPQAPQQGWGQPPADHNRDA